MSGSGSSRRVLPVPLKDVLGAEPFVATQRFGIYLPNKDRHGNEIADIDRWISDALDLLASINGGATSLPPSRGVWLDANGIPLHETTTFVYSFIEPDAFYRDLPLIRKFLHRFGRETDQGEVLVEFENNAYKIRNYDPAMP